MGSFSSITKRYKRNICKIDKRTRNKIRKATNSGLEVVKDNVEIYYAKINTETFLINSRRNYEKEVEYNDSLAEKVQDMSIDEKKEKII